jgi:hypothetical protein
MAWIDWLSLNFGIHGLSSNRDLPLVLRAVEVGGFREKIDLCVGSDANGDSLNLFSQTATAQPILLSFRLLKDTLNHLISLTWLVGLSFFANFLWCNRLFSQGAIHEVEDAGDGQSNEPSSEADDIQEAEQAICAEDPSEEPIEDAEVKETGETFASECQPVQLGSEDGSFLEETSPDQKGSQAESGGAAKPGKASVRVVCAERLCLRQRYVYFYFCAWVEELEWG